MDPYREVWDSFVSGNRLEFGGHKDPKWRNGHTFSSSLILPVEVGEFADRLESLREALRPFPFVSLHPDHFMHVTLLLLGFPVENPGGEDEVSRERLIEISEDARQALSGFPTFEVELKNLNAFPGAAFVEVHDGGGIQRLRDTLRDGCHLKMPTGPPHLTVAYFQAEDGAPVPNELISAIERYREWPIGRTEARSVQLSLLDLKPEYPEPETLAEIPLKKPVS
jgi:2'-5' RNA ligase